MSSAIPIRRITRFQWVCLLRLLWVCLITGRIHTIRGISIYYDSLDDEVIIHRKSQAGLMHISIDTAYNLALSFIAFEFEGGSALEFYNPKSNFTTIINRFYE